MSTSFGLGLACAEAAIGKLRCAARSPGSRRSPCCPRPCCRRRLRCCATTRPMTDGDHDRPTIGPPASASAADLGWAESLAGCHPVSPLVRLCRLLAAGAGAASVRSRLRRRCRGTTRPPPGRCTTSSGVAGGDHAPRSMRDDTVGDRGDQRHVVLDHEQARAGLSRMRSSSGRAPRSRAARCPTTARRSRITFGPCASTHARSTMRRLPVDSSRTNLSRKSPRPISSMSSSTRVVRPRPRSRRRSAGAARRAIGSRTSMMRSSATRDRLLDRERREQPAVLERAAEPEPGRACVGRRGGVIVVAVEHDVGRRRPAGTRRSGRTASSCRRRSDR